MERRRVYCLVLLVALVPACGQIPPEAVPNPGSADTKSASADELIRLNATQVQASGLQTAEVGEDPTPPVMTVTARVKPRAGGEAQVFSPFPGRLAGQRRLPQVGEYVRQGQQIAEVEQQFMASERLQFASTAIELQVSIEQAQQEVDLKRAELNRAQQLYEGGAISQKQLQTAEFELKQAQTKLDGARRAKQQYDAAVSASDTGSRRAPIVAPITGTIITTDAAIGQQIDPARSLLTIADLSTVWVEAAVHERDLSRIYGAKQAEITIPASPGVGFAGKLVTIGNFVNPQNRTVPVIYSVDNRSGALKIEMFVEAHIPTAASASALTIPAAAMVSEGGASVVYVETQPGAYQRRVVSLGQRKGDTIVVSSGLQKGEKVVTVGAQLLRSESLKGEIPVEEEEKREKKD